MDTDVEYPRSRRSLSESAFLDVAAGRPSFSADLQLQTESDLDKEEHFTRSRRCTASRAQTLDETSLSRYFVSNSSGFNNIGSVAETTSAADVIAATLSALADVANDSKSEIFEDGHDVINMFGKSYSELDLVQCGANAELSESPIIGIDFEERESTLSPDVEDDIRAAARTMVLYDDDFTEQDSSSPVAPDKVAAVKLPSPPVHTLKYPFLMPLDAAPIQHDVPNNLSMVEDLSRATLIGVGSNSEIFMVESNGVRVAVKMLKESCRHNAVAASEFEVEYETLIRLRHPNIVQIFGAGHKPRRFLVLEFIDGPNLNALLMRNIAKRGVIQRLRREPTFAFKDLLLRALDVADVCYYLHEKFHPDTVIIHRDIKPDNIGFTSDGTLKVFDFGLCTHVKPRTEDDQAYEMSGNTGSRRYMAPEVCLKKPYTERCDVYSFGILLWQMARDRVPYEHLSREEFVSGVATGILRPKLHKYWPKAFCNLLTDCWNQVPHLRPPFKDIMVRLQDMLRTV